MPSKSNGSGSSSNSRRMQPRVQCSCGYDAVVRTVRNGSNVGSKFYGCPRWLNTNCDMFQLVEETNALEDLRFQLFEKETNLAEMQMLKKFDEDRIKELQMKKANAEDELQKVKDELYKLRIECGSSARNEKNLMIALLISWIFFAIVYSLK